MKKVYIFFRQEVSVKIAQEKKDLEKHYDNRPSTSGTAKVWKKLFIYQGLDIE